MAAPKTTKKIVVIEDDPDMLAFISTVLEDKFKVFSAPDGPEGLELVQKERPDLVVLDLLMPRMHGFEVCQRIRQDRNVDSTKILISTSKSYNHDKLTAEETGADDYIVKPYAPKELLAKVEALIGHVRVPLNIKFWGTRGSLPAPGESTKRYGGNTPCVEFRVGKELVIIDAGSGLAPLGKSLLAEYEGKPIAGHLFLGHFHWDHIQGFPFFAPFFFPDNHFNVYGMRGANKTLKEILEIQMAPPYFPVSLKELRCKMEIVELWRPVNIGPARISYHFLNHPGITVGFRIEAPDWSVCYISDHEPYGKLNAKGDFSDKEDAAIARFVEGCDLLISEAQYTDEEYAIKRSWGHSTFGDVLELAVKAKVKRLALFHHDPTHNDDMMDGFVEKSRKYLKDHSHALECLAAKEGETFSL